MSWAQDPTCALDDSGGEYTHRAAKYRVGDHALCLDCLDLITGMGFVHPAVPTRVNDADAST